MEIKIILCLVIGTIAIISAMLGYQEYAALKRKARKHKVQANAL